MNFGKMFQNVLNDQRHIVVNCILDADEFAMQKEMMHWKIEILTHPGERNVVLASGSSRWKVWTLGERIKGNLRGHICRPALLGHKRKTVRFNPRL